ncbi:type II secretion system protein GspK [Paraglaciecola aquimarina]|uniref:Type II secretion system protein GspK n=1 Tax=Paraglaciecola aquimarina TaxID=1235557 RepID=A0ABU3STB1_9ALTE|nr:type II secretion system protein GspK [Paraglaciecola aquimarina]MDU0353230.1 type II secretion system protein GspK [Paraglaciecola aquimarina]
MDKLLALSCVLPADSSLKINVNTVSEENAGIIAGMTGLTLSQAQSALSARGNDGFDKPAGFLNTAEIKAITLTDEQKKWFDVTTSYFILHTRAKFNDATFAMQTVFKLDSNNKVQVIRREFSGF